MRHAFQQHACLFIVLFASAAFTQAPVSPASDAEHQRLLIEDAKAEDHEIHYLRTQIFKALPPSEAQIVNSIEFDLIGGPRLGDQLILPQAQIENGQRTVIIGQGFIRQLSLFIQEEVYAKQYNKVEEVDRHISLVLQQLKDNQDRVRRGLQPRLVESADQYFHWDQATEDYVFQTSDKLLAINLAFIMAHEAGHHVLGHTSLDRASMTREQRIALEEAADNWAIHTMIASGQLPLSAVMSLLMFERMYQAGLDLDHPSTDCRMRALIVSSINNLDLFRTQLEAAGKSVEGTRQEWQNTLAALDAMGSCSTSNSVGGVSQGGGSGTSQLALIISKAGQHQISTLRGPRDPDLEDAWKPKISPELPVDCYIDYDRDDQSYDYICSARYDDEDSADGAVRNIVRVVSALNGVQDSGRQYAGNKHVYRAGEVRIVVDAVPPRSESIRQKWTVHLLIEEASR